MTDLGHAAVLERGYRWWVNGRVTFSTASWPDDQISAMSSLSPIPATRTSDTVLKFGRCEVRLSTREVLLDGVIQPVQAKVFDVLAYLLTQRPRAVSKKELVEHVWQGAVLSESVLSRTVMMARRLIGDHANAPCWIHNVFGYGYKFTGSVVEETTVPVTVARGSAAKASETRVLRIGLLPLVNEVNDPALAWTSVGLVALVAYALDRDRRLITTALGADFIRQLAPGLTRAAAAREAREIYGLDHVVQATLRSQSDMLWIDYQVFSEEDSANVGSVRDGDVVALGERLARALASELLPGSNTSGAMPSRDAFVNQMFARAKEFGSTQDWPRAKALLAAALVLEPSNDILELEYVRCLVWLNEPEGLNRGNVLLERLLSTLVPSLLTDCHDLIAQALALSGDRNMLSACIDHRDKALAWADQMGPSQRTISLRINTGNFYMGLGQFERSRVHLERALADSRLTENRIGIALSQQNLAIADRADGNLILAKQRLDEALTQWQRMLRRPQRGHALMHLAVVNLNLGLFSESARQCSEALSCFDADQLRGYDGATVAGVSMVYAHLARKDEVLRLADWFRKCDIRDPQRSVPMQVALGCAAAVSGQAPEARQHLLAAASHGVVWPGLSYRLRCLQVLLCMEMALGGIEDLDRCKFAFESMEGAAGLLECKAGIQYANAALQLLRGKRKEALSSLQRLATEWPLSMLSQMARLDTAWLYLELDDPDSASSLMDGAPTWRDNHPAGLALKARWHAGHGRFEEASRLHAQALGLNALSPHPAHAELAVAYKRGVSTRVGEGPPALPQLPRLLSSTFASSFGMGDAS